MDLSTLIFQSQLEEPSHFADTYEWPYGYIYYNVSNPTSHDSNHACICDEENFEAAVKEVTDFYTSVNITPRIYLIDNQHTKYKSILERNGYKIEKFASVRCFVRMIPNSIIPQADIDIKIIDDIADLSEEFFENIYRIYMRSDNDTINRSKNLLSKFVIDAESKLYVGYYDKKPVTMAMLVNSSLGLQYLDLVETAAAYKRKGFASTLLSRILDDSTCPMYLTAINPKAMSMYRKLGFRPFPYAHSIGSYRAVYLH